MPSNIISINLKPQYNMPDSKMDELIKYLEEKAHRISSDDRKKLETKRSPQFAYDY